MSIDRRKLLQGGAMLAAGAVLSSPFTGRASAQTAMTYTPEEGAKVMAQWEAWFKEMGDAVVNPGNPVGMSKTVSGSGVTDDGGDGGAFQLRQGVQCSLRLDGGHARLLRQVTVHGGAAGVVEDRQDGQSRRQTARCEGSGQGHIVSGERGAASSEPRRRSSSASLTGLVK